MILDNKKVLITGADGFVGEALTKILYKRNIKEILPISRYDGDLRDPNDVNTLLSQLKPDVVFHLAGRVGGIGANKAFPAEFYYDNVMINTNILHYSMIHGVKKLVAFGSGGYSNEVPIPYKEEDFFKGLADGSMIGYTTAKKAMVVQSWVYREQYNFDSVVLIPSNIYGPEDCFDPNKSHVVAALVKRIVDARGENLPSIEVWGTGNATREFLYVDDAARAMIKTAEDYSGKGPVNLGTGIEIKIKELVDVIVDSVGYKGEIRWDSSKPDGQPRRVFDISTLLKEIKYVPPTRLEEGIQKTVDWYMSI